MRNYQQLKLPAQLLKNTEFCQPKKYAFGYGVHTNYQDLLSDQVLEIFDRMQLKVKCLVMFSLNNIQRELSDAVAAARILAFLRYCREESNDNQDQ